MEHPFLPQSRWTRKPQFGTVEVDKAHPLADGLLEAWLLNESVGDRTYGLKRFQDGTINNPTNGDSGWGSGKYGQDFNFDGNSSSGSYVSLGTMDVGGGTGITIIVWFNLDVQSPADIRIISKANGTSETTHWWMLSFTGTLGIRARLKTAGTTSTLVGSNSSFNLNQWHQAAFSYDGSNMRLFIDAVQTGSDMAKTGIVDTNNTVGVNIARNPNGYGEMDGRIDHVLLYNRGLAQSEIEWLFYEPFAMVKPRVRRTWFDVDVGGGASIFRIINETVGLNENINTAMGLNRIRGEAIEVVQNINTAMGLNRIRGEAIEVVQNINTAMGLNRIRDEAIEVVQNINTAMGLNRIRDEAIEVVQNINTAMGLNRIRDETIETVQNINTARGVSQVINETLNIIDSFLAVLGLSRTVDETINITEGLNTALGLNRIINETLSLIESIVLTIGKFRVIDETISIVEGIIPNIGVVQVVNETLNLVEGTLTTLGLNRIINEPINLIENFNASMALARIVDEAITILESIVPIRFLILVFDETLNIAENAIHIKGFVLVINESINISEDVVRNFALALDLAFSALVSLNPSFSSTWVTLKHALGSTTTTIASKIRATFRFRPKD